MLICLVVCYIRDGVTSAKHARRETYTATHLGRRATHERYQNGKRRDYFQRPLTALLHRAVWWVPLFKTVLWCGVLHIRAKRRTENGKLKIPKLLK